MRHNVFVPNKSYKGLNPMQFGYEACEKSHFFGPAVRNYYLIHYVVSGFGIFRKNAVTHRLSPGEMFVISPAEETYYEADSKNPWNYIWIGFTGEENFLNNIPSVIRCPEAAEIFNSMKDCESYSNEGRTAYLTGKLWEVFAIISGREISTSDYVESAKDYIHSEYMNKISVSQIAKMLNLDRTYFSALFKKKTSLSPKEYILNYRMNVAASLILRKNISISVVAASVGYSDIFTFSKMFKKHYGVSPKEYKKDLQSSTPCLSFASVGYKRLPPASIAPHSWGQKGNLF